MSDSRSLTGIFVFIGILLFGLWLGVSIVTDQIETLIYIIGGATLITCALLGRKIWLILPFASAINLTLMIPGTPDTLLLAQIMFIGFCLLQFLIRRLNFQLKFTELEYWMLILTLCVAQVYARNPVGLYIFGGDSIGARPYAIYAITLTSCIILAVIRVNSSDLRWFIRLSIIGGLINFTINMIGYFVPRVGVWYGSVNYSAVNGTSPENSQYGYDLASRIDFLGEFANNLALWISSFKSPIRACFHPIWAPLVIISCAFAALSGYRNEIGAVGLTYLVAIAYRGGFSSVLMATVTLLFAIAILAFVNLAAPLPSNIQRSLSFLPGTWDEIHVRDADASTEWRVDMWKEALFTDFWIKNKWLGDGLGMSQHELNFIQSYKDKQIGGVSGTGKLTLGQEFMMASGDYHSGSVSAIRTIGYVGLVVMILMQIRILVHAHRQIMRCKGTPWLPLALFICIPMIWFPFFFIFIFGGFSLDSVALLTNAAILRLLENNLPLPEYIKRSKRQLPLSNSALVQ
jgi:hypothetical protein